MSSVRVKGSDDNIIEKILILQPDLTADQMDEIKNYINYVIAQREVGGLVPRGTVAFNELPILSEAGVGDMYNISDDFTTTDDFTVGAGILYPAGSNVYKLSSTLWDVLVGSEVVGIKGDHETNYRRGNVNLTPADIGSYSKSDFNFTSSDTTLNPTSSEAIDLITDNEPPTSIFSKVSKVIKNTRYLLKMLGSTDISSIGDGTTTGALDNIFKKITNNTSLTTSNKSVIGAINEINGILKNYNTISDLNQVIQTGWGYTMSNALNKPIASNGFVLVVGNGNQVLQVYFTYGVTDNMYYRIAFSNSWSAWTKA